MAQRIEVIRCNTKYLKFKQNLNCKYYGIYVAKCKNCNINMSDKLKINFLYVGLHTDGIETNLNLKKQ